MAAAAPGPKVLRNRTVPAAIEPLEKISPEHCETNPSLSDRADLSPEYWDPHALEVNLAVPLYARGLTIVTEIRSTYCINCYADYDPNTFIRLKIKNKRAVLQHCAKCRKYICILYSKEKLIRGKGPVKLRKVVEGPKGALRGATID